MRDALLEAAAEAVEAGRRAGAANVWASATRSRDVNFEVRNGKLEKVEDSTSKSLSVKLFVDGRFSAHSTTDLRPERVKTFITEAVAMTRALQPDEHRHLADPSRYPKELAALQLADPKVATIDRDMRLAWCSGMNERIAGKPQVISATSSASDSMYRTAAVSSNGFEHAYEASTLSVSSEVTLEDGEKRPEDYAFAVVRHLDGVPALGGIGDDALARARARIGTKKGPTRRTTMIVDARAAGSLVSRLLGPANGGAVQQQRSFWRGNVGKKMVSPRLTIVDDPLIAGGLGSRPFDGEGIASRRLPLVEAGVFANLYLDTYYASKLGLEPTTGSGSNRVVTPGTRGRDALIATAKDAIYVTSWLGGNLDATTGDFSLGVRGHEITGGKLGGPIGEMNVTGNIVELFKALAEVGNDPFPYLSTLAPTLVFEKVQFSGA